MLKVGNKSDTRVLVVWFAEGSGTPLQFGRLGHVITTTGMSTIEAAITFPNI